MVSLGWLLSGWVVRGVCGGVRCVYCITIRLTRSSIVVTAVHSLIHHRLGYMGWEPIYVPRITWTELLTWGRCRCCVQNPPLKVNSRDRPLEHTFFL